MKKGQFLTLNKPLSYREGSISGTVREGSSIIVELVDVRKSKVLVEVGSKIFVWIGFETVKCLTSPAA